MILFYDTVVLVEALSKSPNVDQEPIATIIETLEGFSETAIAGLRMAILAEIKGLYEAFGKFFQDKLALPPDTILKGFVPSYWEWFEDLKEEISEVEVDPEKVADMMKRLDKSWNLRIE